MPKFSIKDLMFATTLIALGFGMVCIVLTVPALNPGAKVFNVLGSAALIGAGLLFPFKRPWLGALLGIVLFVVADIAVTLYIVSHVNF